VRVLHVITRLMAGGAQLNTVRTAALQSSYGVQSTILYGSADSEHDGDLRRPAEIAGVRFESSPHVRREPTALADLRATLDLIRRLRRQPYDIIHTHTSKAGFIGRLAARAVGSGVVVHTPHGHVFHSYYGPLTTRLYVLLERCAAGWADRVVALTERERDEHLDYGIGDRTRYVVVPSGIDVDRFRSGPSRQQARAALGLAGDRHVIGCVGRLVPIKGQDVLIRAFAELAAGDPDALLLLAGAGHDRDHLEQLVRSLGLAGQVRFLGQAEAPERLYPALDVLAVPSRNEGMGRVVLEGMAAGSTIVASAIGGILDLVEDGVTGRLVPVGEPRPLATAMIDLLANPERRRTLGASARSAVTTRFGEEAMALRLLALYRELSARGRYDRPAGD